MFVVQIAVDLDNRSLIFLIVQACYLSEIPVKLDTREWEDIHVIAGALKLFLRELPEPVIPFKFFDKYIATCSEYC